MRFALAAVGTLVAVAFAAPKVSDQQCVTTIGLPGGCCPPHSSASATVLIDCKGEIRTYMSQPMSPLS